MISESPYKYNKRFGTFFSNIIIHNSISSALRSPNFSLRQATKYPIGAINLKEIDPQEGCHCLAQSYFVKQCEEEKCEKIGQFS